MDVGKTREKEVDVVPCVNMIHHLSANDITPANITEMEIHLLLLFDWTIHPCVPSEIYYPLLVKTLSVTGRCLAMRSYEIEILGNRGIGGLGDGESKQLSS